MVDVNELKNGIVGKKLFQISDELFRELSPGIDLFRHKFGYKIDQYSDCKLTSNIGDLAICIQLACSSPPSNPREKLMQIITHAAENSSGLIFLGD